MYFFQDVVELKIPSIDSYIYGGIYEYHGNYKPKTSKNTQKMKIKFNQSTKENQEIKRKKIKRGKEQRTKKSSKKKLTKWL